MTSTREVQLISRKFSMRDDNFVLIDSTKIQNLVLIDDGERKRFEEKLP